MLLTDCTVTANSAADSGGIEPTSRGTITSVTTDWGTGGTDNTPTDIGTYVIDGTASFECAGLTCVE